MRSARRGWAQVADDLLHLSARGAAGPLFSPEGP
jgi:hypothetical protein